MKNFETIVNLGRPMLRPDGPVSSSSLEQHCSAMRMDDRFNWTSNQLLYALTDAKKVSA